MSDKIVPFPGPSTPFPSIQEEKDVEIPIETVSITEWLEVCRYLEGKPINFDEQPWIKEILNCSDPWQVWQAGRQVAKSTSLVNLLLAYGCNVPYLKQLYVTPTFKQTTVFSNDRLRPAIFESPPIMDLFWHKDCTNQVLARGLATPSQILLRHCFLSADSARGISAHVLMLDEIQDLLVDLVPVLEETTSAARRNELLTEQGYADIRRYCGTPKTFDSALEKYWQMSSQNEWLVPCDHCGGGDYRFWNKLDEDNIGPEGLICKKCVKDIDWGAGNWYKSISGARWTGWRISQLMATQPRGWIKWEDILHKQRTYKTYQFHNEVLGFAFDSGMRPITLEQLHACCKPEYSLETIPKGVYQCFGGLDWQMEAESFDSYTIFTIYAVVNRRFQLQYVKKFQGREAADPDSILRHVIQKMEEYGVAVLGCDWGVGHKENVRLKNNIGHAGDRRVFEYQYTAMGPERKWDDHRQCWMLDRTRCMEEFFEAMKQKWVWFPQWNEFEPYHRDIYALYSEYNTVQRKQVYLHREPDDFFHSSLYAWEACNYFYNYEIKWGTPQIARLEDMIMS